MSFQETLKEKEAEGFAEGFAEGYAEAFFKPFMMGIEKNFQASLSTELISARLPQNPDIINLGIKKFREKLAEHLAQSESFDKTAEEK